MNRWLKALIPGILITCLLFYFYKHKTKKPKNLTDVLNKKGKSRTWSATYALIPDLQKIHSTYDLPEQLKADHRVLNQRLESAGLNAEIKIDDNQIIVVLPQVTDTTADLSKLFTADQSIGFWETYNIGQVNRALQKISELDVPQKPEPIQQKSIPVTDTSISADVKQLIDDMHKTEEKEQTAAKTIFRFNISEVYTSDAAEAAVLAFVLIADSARARQIMQDTAVTALLPPESELVFGADMTKHKIPLICVYALRNHRNKALPQVGDKDLERTIASFNSSKEPEIVLQFDHMGTRKWETLTRNNIGRYIAITVNDFVISAPRVMSEINEGSAAIAGGFTSILDASIFAAQLKSGRLPLPLMVKNKKFKLNQSNRELWLDILVFAGLLLFLTGLSYFVIKQLETP